MHNLIIPRDAFESEQYTNATDRQRSIWIQMLLHSDPGDCFELCYWAECIAHCSPEEITHGCDLWKVHEDNTVTAYDPRVPQGELHSHGERYLRYRSECEELRTGVHYDQHMNWFVAILKVGGKLALCGIYQTWNDAFSELKEAWMESIQIQGSGCSTTRFTEYSYSGKESE